MVKVGFICEGDVEKLLVESQNFQDFLIKSNIQCVRPVINAMGNGNLLPHNIVNHRKNLLENGSEIIIILTDLDNDLCFTLTKERIEPHENEIVVISKKQIEAWFLADSISMSNFCGQDYYFEFPEKETIPYDTIRKELLRITERGYGKNAKLRFADKFIQNGFSIENAAKHPNCPSATYFINKLKNLSSIAQ